MSTSVLPLVMPSLNIEQIADWCESAGRFTAVLAPSDPLQRAQMGCQEEAVAGVPPGQWAQADPGPLCETVGGCPGV